jgi:DNA-binding NarL/FixJ family response regulator
MTDHMDTIRILLVDDQSIILDGLEALIAQNDRFAVCGRANNGREAVQLALEQKPDVVLMDISMPEMDGIEATREVKKRLKQTHVLMLTMYNNADFVRELLDAGASGYLLKNTGRAELWEAILTVVTGQRYLAKPVQDMLNARNAELAEQGSEPDFHALTKREKQIAKLLVEGATSQDIADKLFLSTSTIETHRKNIHHKLGVHSTAGIVRYAMERGWMQEAS